MSDAAAASALSASRLATDVGYAVQKKALNIAQQQGDAVVALIQQAGKVGQSGGTDSLAAAATGLGGKVDQYG